MKKSDSNPTLWVLSFMCILLVLITFSINSASVIVSPLESNGAIPVNIQDQHTPIIDMHLLQIFNEFTLNSNVSIGQDWFIADAGHNITILDMINIYENTSWYQAEVLTVVSNNITVDTPFDFPFSDSSIGERGNRNLAVDGSVSNIMFTASPKHLNDVDWDVTRLIFVMITNSKPDGSRFGDIIGGITNGIYIRSVNGITKNLFNAKTNSDLAAHSYDISYDDRAQGSGFYQTTVRTSFAGQSKRGVTIRLTSLTNDTFEVGIQDDLLGITDFQAIIQGHSILD